MYINHLTLANGHISRIQRGDVAGETLARVAPWLAALTAAGTSAALPVSNLADYSAHASVLDGSLIVTISGPPVPGHDRAPPLATMGVAKRSRHAAALWPLLCGPVMPPVKRGLQQPAPPWVAVTIWPSIALHPQSSAWLGDLERCIAWAWVTRPIDTAGDE